MIGQAVEEVPGRPAEVPEAVDGMILKRSDESRSHSPDHFVFVVSGKGRTKALARRNQSVDELCVGDEVGHDVGGAMGTLSTVSDAVILVEGVVSHEKAAPEACETYV